MGKINDYRTPAQKRKDAVNAKIKARYLELKSEGLADWRASGIIAEEIEWTVVGVYHNIKRQKKREERR